MTDKAKTFFWAVYRINALRLTVRLPHLGLQMIQKKPRLLVKLRDCAFIVTLKLVASDCPAAATRRTNRAGCKRSYLYMYVLHVPLALASYETQRFKLTSLWPFWSFAHFCHLATHSHSSRPVLSEETLTAFSSVLYYTRDGGMHSRAVHYKCTISTEGHRHEQIA